VGQQQQQPAPPDPTDRVAPPGGLQQDAGVDRDGDGVPDRNEAMVGGERTRFDTDGDGVDDRDEGRRRGGVATAVDRDTAVGIRANQRDEFGGFNWGSAFFGWLVAIGLGALLTALISGAGAAIGLTDSGAKNAANNNADTVTIVGGALLIVVSMIAYYCGGYVAGRMSRFDGARQGFGVWVIGLIITVAIAAAGWIFGDKYNVLDKLNLPRIPVNASDLTTGGLIALAAIVLGTLIAAMVGGKVGQRYHTRIDRYGFGERRL
jgi:hypothetical protein